MYCYNAWSMYILVFTYTFTNIPYWRRSGHCNFCSITEKHGTRHLDVNYVTSLHEFGETLSFCKVILYLKAQGHKIVPGDLWLSDRVIINIVTAYLDKGQHNIIAVDWSRLCPAPSCPSAAYNAKFTGKCIAQIVDALRMEGVSNIHIIGFSLGAHVAAFTATSLRPYILPRITGTLSNYRMSFDQTNF